MAKVSWILLHQGVQLILAYSWARPAILVAVKGSGGMFLFLLLLHFHSSFFPVPLLSPLLSLFSLSLGDDTKWPTRADVSLNPNTINQSINQCSKFRTTTMVMSSTSRVFRVNTVMLCPCFRGLSGILLYLIQPKWLDILPPYHTCSNFSSPGLCPWRAYVVTQSLASASVGVGARVHVSTMFKFSKVCIVF